MSLVFSGKRKDPEMYLHWEENMEKWLQSNKIPKEKKLQQAVSAFTEKAYEWWLRENTPSFYNKPVLDWEDLKARMYIEFSEKCQGWKCTTTRIYCQATPQRVLSTLKQQCASKHNNAHAPESRKVLSSAFFTPARD
ncbi:hypothetical protein Bca4012_058555 [Brassica carinata]